MSVEFGITVNNVIYKGTTHKGYVSTVQLTIFLGYKSFFEITEKYILPMNFSKAILLPHKAGFTLGKISADICAKNCSSENVY
jgi:hypothetical protein